MELHRALHHFRPITEDYSSQPYHESFNWDDLELPADVEGEWYCVAFRSRRKVESDSQCALFTCVKCVSGDSDRRFLYHIKSPLVLLLTLLIHCSL